MDETGVDVCVQTFYFLLVLRSRVHVFSYASVCWFGRSFCWLAHISLVCICSDRQMVNTSTQPLFQVLWFHSNTFVINRLLCLHLERPWLCWPRQKKTVLWNINMPSGSGTRQTFREFHLCNDSCRLQLLYMLNLLWDEVTGYRTKPGAVFLNPSAVFDMFETFHS